MPSMRPVSGTAPGSATPPAPVASDPPRRRQACERCWKRKQKCDRLLPACTSCAELHVECEARKWAPETLAQGTTLNHAALLQYVAALRPPSSCPSG